jgi:hypothetical protein
MQNIFDTTDNFDFEKLSLSKPISIPGGNFFIKFSINNSNLYIQPPKCKTKQGIIKAGKRIYSDLMFTNENDQFIRWMENLENHCQEYIYKNKEEWFEGDLELHDIENYFTSPMKLYKSGKYYTLRTNVSTVLGKPVLKIYDEDENELDIEKINDDMDIMTILEIQGIKCSTRSFQIEIEIKQMMTLKQVNLFEKCIIKPKVTQPKIDDNLEKETEISLLEREPDNNDEIKIDTSEIANDSNEEDNIQNMVVEETTLEKETTDNTINDVIEIEETPDIIDNNEMQEVNFNLEELPENETMQIKKRNDVYYEMYREARRKAKIARDLALSSYLEAKQIKNTYMLDDIKDSDDSDEEFQEFYNNNENL